MGGYHVLGNSLQPYKKNIKAVPQFGLALDYHNACVRTPHTPLLNTVFFTSWKNQWRKSFKTHPPFLHFIWFSLSDILWWVKLILQFVVLCPGRFFFDFLGVKTSTNFISEEDFWKGYKGNEDSEEEDKRQYDCGEQTSLQGRKYPPEPEGTTNKKNQVWALKCSQPLTFPEGINS